MDTIIDEALEKLKNKMICCDIDFNNEIGLQIELIIILRELLGDDYWVYPERNIIKFGFNKEFFVKKEIDISIIEKNSESKFAIELKYPTQGQYPEQMFKVCEDIKFLEQLKENGFSKNFFIMLAKDPNFYSNKGGGQIYEIFRRKKKIEGLIIKPTVPKNREIEITGKYEFSWKTIKNNMKYFIVVI